GAVALREDIDAAIHLGANRRARQPAIGAEAAVIAVDATADRDGAVHVGAREAAVDGDAINLAAEALAQRAAEGIVALLRREQSRQLSFARHHNSPRPRRKQASKGAVAAGSRALTYAAWRGPVKQTGPGV